MHAAITADGPSAEPVFQKVVDALAEVRFSLESRHHPRRGPVIRYAIDQVRTGSHRPVTHEGVQSPAVHTAMVSVSATFNDFDDLAVWVGWCSQVDGFAITVIDWALTVANRGKIERRARQKAVRDAKRRAQDYADALDLGPVEVSSLSDPGLGGPVARKVVMAAAMSAPGGPENIVLRPDDVEITAEVDAVFSVHAAGVARRR